MRADLRPFGTIGGKEPPAPGGLFDVPEDEARRLIAAGQAEEPDEAAGPADHSPRATPWAGTYQLVLPGDPDPAGAVRTDGRALTGRPNLRRELV
jgi:hypothetical protein